MDNESQLSIVVQAVDNASGVIAGVQEKITTLDTSVAKAAATIKQMEVATTELTTAEAESATAFQENTAIIQIQTDAANGLYDAQNRIMEASMAAAMAQQEEAAAAEAAALAAEKEAAAAAENAVAIEADGEAHSALVGKMDQMATRFIAHAILITSLIAVYSYLKTAVTDAEAANANFDTAMKKIEASSKATQTAIGEALAPAIVNLGNTFTNANSKIQDTAQEFKGLGQWVYQVTNLWIGLGRSVELVVSSMIEGVKLMYQSAKSLITGNTDELNASMNNLVKNFDESMKKINDSRNKAGGDGFDELFTKFSTGAATVTKAAENMALKLSTATATMKNDYETLTAKVTQDLENLETTHEAKVTSITTKLESLSQSYNDTTAAASSALTALAEKHTNAMDSINKSIESVQTNINNLNTSYANQGTSNVDSLVKAFAKAQEDVTKLQAAIADPTTSASTKTSDQKQLTEDQAALARNADLAKQYSTQIADFIAEDNKTGLEQAIDSFNLKQTQEALAYNTKLSQYNGEIAALNTKSSAETASYNQEVAHSKALYAEKIQKIGDEFAATEKAFIKEQTEFDAKETALKKIHGDAEAEMQKINTATKDLTIKNVQAEIEIYHQLAAAMAAVNNARSAGAVPVVSSVARKMATGGIVDSPTLALIGEDGPEAVVPLDNSQGVRALPATTGAGAGGSVVVNLYYPQVNSDGNIALIKQQLEQALRPLFLNAKPSYV